MKKVLLTIEAIVLIGPITVVLCYTTFLTVIIGIPASVSQQFNSSTNYDLFLPVSAIGNVAGDYAIVVLWLVVVQTIRGKSYNMSKHFYGALFAGVAASAGLIFIYKIHGLVYGVIPVAIAATHFVFMQKGMQSNA